MIVSFLAARLSNTHHCRHCVTLWIPSQVPNKIQHILCTGNMVTKEQYDEFRALAPNVHVVAGDLDQVLRIS